MVKINSNKGFSLLEIMIAMTIFAVFITAYVVAQGGNLADSTLLREEIFLRQLCEERINEILFSPPELKDSLTLSNDTKTFEKYPTYEYTVKWKKLKIPDLSKFQAKSTDSDGQEDAVAAASGIEKTLMNKLKENMEKLIWQIEVTVKNKETSFNYTASTWVMNEKYEVKIDNY